ncbi:cysteine desulfurase [Candidatus Parcubacteria bacterium]|nr:cysteine desulfurase [Candidatus Parcubacteria bacterium]
MNDIVRKKFKVFRQSNYLYLDSAAMTPTPTQVVSAVQHAMDFRGNPNRSAHPLAQRSGKLLDDARKTVADFIGAQSEEIVFTRNTTDSINLAIEALAHLFEEGDVIVLSTMEHHSNMLPYLKLRRRGVHTKFVPTKERCIKPDDVVKALTPQTKIVAITHCSNVLGTINDVTAIGKAIKQYNKDIIYIIDGAQAVAHIPVNVEDIGCDMYAFSGHKMYGPDGIGVLYVKRAIQHLLAPVRAGGGSVNNVAITHGISHDLISPDYDGSLSMLEGGTPNVSGAVGLAEAVKFLTNIGMNEIREHEIKLTHELINRLDKINNLIIHGPKDARNRVGLVSFAVDGVSPKELGTYLAGNDICVRYGSHCAFPLTNELGHETVRLSVGVYNTEADINLAVEEIENFLARKYGESKNNHLALIRNIPIEKKEILIKSIQDIENNVRKFAKHNETEILIMGGHFLGIPDTETNTFFPSIAPLIPKRLTGLLEEFGMTTFPLVTFEAAAQIVSNLKADGIKAKLFIIANDTTGINELRLSPVNKEKKTADQYRKELLAKFSGEIGIPDTYWETLKKHNLSLDDVMKFGENHYIRETILRKDFKSFVSKNKKFFNGLIDYRADNESIDVSIKVLDNNDVKTCTFDTFHSKTGGTFCVVEVAELMAELFGKDDNVEFKYLNQKVLSPKVTSTHKALVMLSPAMCDDAVTNGAELYTKLFQREFGKGFMFLNTPFGPHSEQSLKEGTLATEIIGT